MQHAAAKWFSQQIMRPTAVGAEEHATWISHACPNEWNWRGPENIHKHIQVYRAEATSAKRRK